MNDSNENTTDATRGSSLRVRVEARKQELELALSTMGSTDGARRDVELALSGVNGLLSGNLDEIPHVVAAELNTWLEASKHINERHQPAAVSEDRPEGH